MRNAIRLIGLVSLVGGRRVSCGDVVRQGSSPVYLVIDQLQGMRGAVQPGTPSATLISDVITNVTSPAPCTTDSAVPDDFRRQRSGDASSAAQGHRRHGVPVADVEQRGHDQPRPRRVRPCRRPQYAGRRCAVRVRQRGDRHDHGRRDAHARLRARAERGEAGVAARAASHQPQLHRRDCEGDLLRRGPRRQRHSGDRAADRSSSATLGTSRTMPFTYSAERRSRSPLFAVAGCTVKSTEAPPLAGPSGLALSLHVNAVPDSISQDGGSQSSVKVTAIGPDGRPSIARCRCAWTCSSAAWRRTTARCPRARS